MRLTLALVVDRTADRCTVRVLGEPDARTAGYSAPFRPRAGSLGPGSLVAVDLATTPPEVVWRWFPATVLAVDEGRVRLAEPHHGVVEAAAVGPAVRVGQVVHVTTALGDGWRIDAPADDPERARAALSDVAALYERTGRT
jgi:hypothetical protein